MHVGALVDLRGAAARRTRSSPRTSSRACTWCRATARSSPFPRFEMGRPFWVDDPQLQHRLPRAPHRAARARARTSSCASSPGGSSPSASTARSRSGRSGWSRASRAAGSRSSRRPTTRWWTACRGWTSRPCCSTSSRSRPSAPERGRRGSPRRSRPTPSWSPRGSRGSCARRSSLAGRALGALGSPGRSLEQAREAAEGLGEVVWAGMNPAPDVPLNVPIGPHRRVRWVQSRLSDFKEIKNALGGTVNDAVLAVVAGALGPLAAHARRAHRGPRAARAGAGLDPRRGRARRARQPDRRDARPAARLRRRTRSSGCASCGRRWATSRSPSRRSAPR